MKSYSVHKIYIIIIGFVLIMLGETLIQQVIDPTYHVISTRYVPRALMWYLIIYGWYKFLTIANKIEFTDDNSIKTTSLIQKKTIKAGEIEAVRDRSLYTDIVTREGSTSVSNLMEGVSNVYQVLQAFASSAIKDGEIEYSPLPIKRKRIIMKTIIVVLLIIFAVIVEWQQIVLRENRF